MDWEGIGLSQEVLCWLEETSQRQATRERRLDPFATSMRDFDDVAPQLRDIQNTGQLQHAGRVTQRVADLRTAGLITGDVNKASLTPLGTAVLAGWRAAKVANVDPADEAIRMVILYGTARKLGLAPYTDFFAYWAELRAVLNAEELIDSWDSLFTLNYLDFRLSGFAPGDAYRDERCRVDQIEYDLDDFVEAVGGSAEAVKGADQVGGRIQTKIPRGKSRATACLAMELLLRDPAARPQLAARFGLPNKPRLWTQFDSAQVGRLLTAVAQFDAAPSTIQAIANPLNAAPPATGVTTRPATDFAKALKPPPVLAKTKKAGKQKKAGPKKIDHQRRQERNSEVGSLGEEFALAFECWRLRNHPKLAKKVKRVSLEDDTLGFDIASFEEDGSPRWVEVKATEGPLSTRFFLSLNEIEVAKANSASYVVLRVGNVRTNPVCCEIRPPFDELDLTTSVYQATFKRSRQLGTGDCRSSAT